MIMSSSDRKLSDMTIDIIGFFFYHKHLYLWFSCNYLFLVSTKLGTWYPWVKDIQLQCDHFFFSQKGDSLISVTNVPIHVHV